MLNGRLLARGALRVFTPIVLTLSVALLVSTVALSADEKSGAAKAGAHAPAGTHTQGAESHDAHGGSHGSHDPTAKDPLSVDTDLAAWTLVVFLVLLVVLKKFAWGPILEGLDKREQRIADSIAQAEANRAESKKLLADYETKLAKAQEEVRAIIEEARRDAEHTKQEIITTARTEAATEMARARHDVELARDQALQQLMQASANLAVDLAGKIVQAKLNPADHAKLIADSLTKFPAASRN